MLSKLCSSWCRRAYGTAWRDWLWERKNRAAGSREEVSGDIADSPLPGPEAPKNYR